MRIHTITLNPALDLSGHVHEIIPNEKNYVSQHRLDAGGNGINAARMAARLGSPVTVFGFLGGTSGEQVHSLLRRETASESMHFAFTPIRDSTRINVTVTNDLDHNQTRLTFPGPQISGAEMNRMLRQIRGLRGPGIFVLGGSFPGGCNPPFASKILHLAAKNGLSLVIDSPAKCMKPILDDAGLPLLLIKPNRVELETILEKRLTSMSQIRRAALAALERSALVCVSLGHEGAILAAQNRLWHADPLKIRARGSVGAGDAMVGAMTSRLLHWKLLSHSQIEHASEEAIRDIFAWGMAAGAATCETEGTALGAAKRIGELVAQVRIKKCPAPG